MQQPNVICLVIDRLHAGYLGAYGNTWVSTPALDALAAQSFVLDRATIDSPQLETIYRSLWLDLHALCRKTMEPQREPLAAIFSRNGWHTALLADETTVTEHPIAAAFMERVLTRSTVDKTDRRQTSSTRDHAVAQNDDNLSPVRKDSPVAATVEETDAAVFFAAVEQWLKAASSPFLLWLHTGTLGRTWDAPLEFRQQFADEDDPPPSNWADVPHQILPERVDPDVLLAITHAYAGQVSLVDQLIGSLLQVIDGTGHADDTLLVCFSTRGFPLGEHHRVGSSAEALYAELTHVPCMMRLPPGLGSPGRSQHLVQPADWSATILDACGLQRESVSANHVRQSADKLAAAGCGRSILPLIRGEQAAGFDQASIVALPDQQVFITPIWSLRLSNSNVAESEHTFAESSAAQPAQHVELFVKPDDWFEVNEVSDRCLEIVPKMQTALTQFIQACQTGQPALLANLPDELTTESE
jgi:arylsulfatase A-like enzyme